MKKLALILTASAFALAADIEVEGAWLKTTAPNAKNTAIFMKIKNNSSADISLISAKEQSLGAATEIHDHIHEGGKMKMVEVPEIKIPANSTVELKPKSLHIMLMGIPAQITKDTHANLALGFSDGSSIRLDIAAKDYVPEPDFSPEQ